RPTSYRRRRRRARRRYGTFDLCVATEARTRIAAGRGRDAGSSAALGSRGGALARSDRDDTGPNSWLAAGMVHRPCRDLGGLGLFGPGRSPWGSWIFNRGHADSPRPRRRLLAGLAGLLRPCRRGDWV